MRASSPSRRHRCRRRLMDGAGREINQFGTNYRRILSPASGRLQVAAPAPPVVNLAEQRRPRAGAVSARPLAWLANLRAERGR